MKKVLFVGMVFGALALTSCKKDYTCDFGMEGVPNQEYTDLDKDEADAAESACKLVGGTWSEK
ncbi:hypothetical protein [Brumimicrobium oceani]|uniref:Lipoprotein n=1 Tax=Brumimicrobium oceani TaxID=2100725 RepID=A0A2U2X0T5_9FLAO|nr:hypothetical protein [Brumimicrobium oceani]PWH81370.1 hypothetical protein DIT68_15190 [Brumimicrobium oceani]